MIFLFVGLISITINNTLLKTYKYYEYYSYKFLACAKNTNNLDIFVFITISYGYF